MDKKIRQAFDKIQVDQQTKDHLAQAVTRQTKNGKAEKEKKSVRKWTLSFVSVAFVAMIAIFGGQYYLQTPVSFISVDVNPSVELSLNRLNKVVEAEPKNEDGRAVLADLELSGMDYVEAVETIVNREKSLGYFDGEAELVVTIASSREETLQEAISASPLCKELGVTCQSVNKELAEAARESGLSMGKYKRYLQIKEVNPDFTVEECADMSMRQLRRLAEGEDEPTENVGSEDGAGNGQKKQLRKGKS